MVMIICILKTEGEAERLPFSQIVNIKNGVGETSPYRDTKIVSVVGAIHESPVQKFRYHLATTSDIITVRIKRNAKFIHRNNSM